MYTPSGDNLSILTRVKSSRKENCVLESNKMKTLILCLCIATTVAWPSGVYILGQPSNQFYNPLIQPHSKLDLDLGYREAAYRVVEQLVDKARVCTTHCFL